MAFIEGYQAGANKKLQSQQMTNEAQKQKAEMYQKGYQFDENGQISVIPNSDAAVNQANNQQALQLAASLQAKLSMQDTDKAIQDYISSGDATYLQRALDNNPQLKDVWAKQGVQLIQNLDFGNDSKLLAGVGVNSDHYDTPEKQAVLKKNMYKYYDGKDYHVGLINNVVAQTGAMSRMNQQQADTIFNHMRELQNALKGTTNANEDQRVAIEKQTADAGTQNAKTNAFNAVTNAKNVEYNHADAMAQLAVRREEAAVKLKTEGTTSTQKDLMAADSLTGNLLSDFGATREDSSNFFKTDFSKRENYEKGYRYISKIEKLEGVQLSEKDKDNIGNMRQLIALADPASKITGSDTGIIDKNLGDLKNYLDDNVKGAKAKAAYTTFRNIMRRNMSGQALTDSEIKANTEAMGQLGEQLGPTLAKFQTSLIQVKSQLDGMNTMLNPYSVQIRLGADQKKIDNIMSNIDRTLTQLQGARAANADTGISELPKDQRKPMSEIFNSNPSAATGGI